MSLLLHCGHLEGLPSLIIAKLVDPTLAGVGLEITLK